MPTKTWEPPPRQSDSKIPTHAPKTAEPRNFESPRGDRARNPDAPEPEPGYLDYDEINLHGSER